MELLTCKAAMKRLHLSRATILEMLETGELTGFRRKRTVRIAESSIDELINATRQAAKKPER